MGFWGFGVLGSCRDWPQLQRERLDNREADGVTDRGRYYRAGGFSPYYFANVVFNVVKNSSEYLRGIEDIMGDVRAAWFAKPFKTYTNLHEFARSIISSVLFEGVFDSKADLDVIAAFLRHYKVPFIAENFVDDADALCDVLGESEEYENALDELTDEVFHVLFNDVIFLQEFNKLCARYIETAFFDEDQLSLVKKNGTLRRTAIPAWVRKAIYHRDKAECRECKKSLAKTINQLDSERYDHIVPLARYGANDVTNLQLLCEPCNAKKSSELLPVSPLYQKAFQS